MRAIVALLGALAVAAPAGAGELWVVAPARIGNLAACASEAAALPANARRVESPLRIRWEGGTVTLPGSQPSGDRWSLLDLCFALVADGRVVVAGAVLSPYSARRLRIPVLQLGKDESLDLLLVPTFPASPPPPSWRTLLPRLEGGG